MFLVTTQFFYLNLYMNRRIFIKLFNKKNIITTLTIAFLYAVLTIAFSKILSSVSFGILQIRISDALTVLPIFSFDAILGLTIGCAIANTYGVFFNDMIPPDIIAGTLATLIAAILTYEIGKTKSKKIKYVFGPLPTVLVNAIIVGIELTIFYTKNFKENLFLNIFYVLLAKFVICYTLGLLLMYVLFKNNLYRKIFG